MPAQCSRISEAIRKGRINHMHVAVVHFAVAVFAVAIEAVAKFSFQVFAEVIN